MQHLHLPTPDFFAPKQEDIQALVFHSLKTWFHPALFDVSVTVSFQAAVQFITQFVSRGASFVISITLLSSMGYFVLPKH